MTKIEERLDLAFKHESDVTIALNAWQPGAADMAADKRDAIRDAIVEGWNAAAEALRTLIAQSYTQIGDHGWWCRACHADDTYDSELHNITDCPIAAAQAALARMEGMGDE